MLAMIDDGDHGCHGITHPFLFERLQLQCAAVEHAPATASVSRTSNEIAIFISSFFAKVKVVLLVA